MGRKMISIFLASALLLTGCATSNSPKKEDQSDSQLDNNTVETNNTKNQSKEVKLLDEESEINDLSGYQLVGNLINNDKVYFKSSGSYFEQEQASSILVEGEGGISVVVEGFTSKPKINPAGDKVAFVDYIGFEVKGNLQIYDIKSETINKVTDMTNFGKGTSTVKDCEWLDDNSMFLIIGYDMGTITQGGAVYLFDVNSKELELVYGTGEKEEVVDVSIEGSDVLMKIVHWTDDNYENYEYREENLVVSELL